MEISELCHCAGDPITMRTIRPSLHTKKKKVRRLLLLTVFVILEDDGSNVIPQNLDDDDDHEKFISAFPDSFCTANMRLNVVFSGGRGGGGS